MFVLLGTVLDVEPVSGGQGADAYAYTRVSMLVGKADVMRVSVKPETYQGPRLAEGEEVALRVRCTAFKGRDGNAALAVTALSRVDAETLDRIAL